MSVVAMHGTAHRKSAVELLKETKANYVKSEGVLDRNQELRHSKHLQVRPLILSASTLTLKKSPSSDAWSSHTDYYDRPRSVDLYPVERTQSLRREITAAQPRVSAPSAQPAAPPFELSPSEEERLLIEQLVRSPAGQCTCHVVFSKSRRQPRPPQPKPAPVPLVKYHTMKTSRRERHQRSESAAARNQLQSTLRRLLWDEQFDDSLQRQQPSAQQHKSLPDLRANEDDVPYDALHSPDTSLEFDAETTRCMPITTHAVSPAKTMPECTWTFFEGEPITLSAPPEFMDAVPPPVPPRTPEPPLPPPPLDAPNGVLLERFFRQMGLQEDALSVSGGSSPVFFASGGSGETGGRSSGSEPRRGGNEETSVVERNARIIKWLCQCRRAGLPPPPPPDVVVLVPPPPSPPPLDIVDTPPS